MEFPCFLSYTPQALPVPRNFPEDKQKTTKNTQDPIKNFCFLLVLRNIPWGPLEAKMWEKSGKSMEFACFLSYTPQVLPVPKEDKQKTKKNIWDPIKIFCFILVLRQIPGGPLEAKTLEESCNSM